MPGSALRALRWMGWLFVVGSTCFAVGVPVSLNESFEGWVWASIFFVGALFFTAASSVQMRLAWVAMDPSSSREHLSWLRRALRWRDLAWSSSLIQWVGTLFFIATTFRTLVETLDMASRTAVQVWRPDALGSILFLVSSVLALFPEVRRHRHGHARNRSWTIAAINMLGSIFFGVSAIGAYTVPSSGELVDSQWANNGTFFGAVCFLIGAILVIPRHVGHSSDSPS